MNSRTRPDHPGDRTALDSVERAVDEIAAGRPVVVVDDEDRENEGDLIFAAELATPELMAFTVRHTSGVVCAPMPGDALDVLELPPMTAVNQDPKGTAYTVSTDARTGITTGISAADRARTVQLLADPTSGPADFTRPGHVFPLRAVPGGVLARPGHTEAAVDLTTLAGLPPVGVIAEIVADDGSMARLPRLLAFGREHGLAVISIEDLIAFRRRSAVRVARAAVVNLPTEHGSFTAIGYEDRTTGAAYVALVAGGLDGRGRLEDGADVPVRLHSGCLTGDAFGSLRCDCGPQLQEALRRIAEGGRGVVVHLPDHEGRGIGLSQKLRAYALQEAGRDTVDANLELGLPVDARDWTPAADILEDLGVTSCRLMSNNPDKVVGLTSRGMRVTDTESLPAPAGPDNIRYLATKRDRMGHRLPWLASAGAAMGGM